MARYKVTTPRFFGKGGKACLYGPGSKRQFVTFDKPFPKDKTPEGLVLVSAPTAAEKKAGIQETDDVTVKTAMVEMISKGEGLNADGIPNVAPLERKVKCKVGKDLRDKLMQEITADADKAEEDKNDIADVTFIEGNKPEPSSNSSAVETL